MRRRLAATTIRGKAAALVFLLSTGTFSAEAQTAPIPEAPIRYDADHLSASFHRSRRAALLQALPANGVAVLFGSPERNRSNDTNFEYRQDSDFYYLTGSVEPGSALILSASPVAVDGRSVREILFVPPRDAAQEVWTGRRFGPERAMRDLGVELALDNERFEAVLASVLSGTRARALRLAFPGGVELGSALAAQIDAFRRITSDPGAATVQVDATTLRGALDRLRERKSEEEAAALRRAIDITVEAHREVARALEPGWTEYEVEALVEYTFKRGGAEHPGFPSIVGSGENSVILHYESNRRTTKAGDLVVIDIGAEYRGYSADVTRTLPVSGRFSLEQREIYSIVYEAQEAGIKASRAGATMGDVNRTAYAVLASGLARLGLIRSATDMAGVRRFGLHGVSHYIGLDVHDAGTNEPMQPGVFFTVEPGIYIPPAADVDPKWWNIGVRIEDDVMITSGDPVVLSAGAPRRWEDVERLMAEGRAP